MTFLSNIKNLYFDPHSMGITQRSLKNLRDSLALGLNHEIAVVETPTNDLCCGFFVFDKDDESASFTGDGFRTDRAGEGGAGYRSAEALFALFGIPAYQHPEIIDFDTLCLPFAPDMDAFRRVAQSVLNMLIPGDFVIPCESIPRYVR